MTSFEARFYINISSIVITETKRNRTHATINVINKNIIKRELLLSALLLLASSTSTLKSDVSITQDIIIYFSKRVKAINV